MSGHVKSILLAGCALAACTSSNAGEGDIFANGFERSTNALVFTMPFQGTPQPASGDVDFTARIDVIDMYVILDRSGSMSSEITNVKNNLASVVDQLQCPPFGIGTPGSCIADLWAGAGTVGYSGSGVEAYRNWVDVQPNPNFSGLPTTEPTGCCAEPLNFSVYATITGDGGSTYGFPLVAARASCSTSPAGNAGFETFGYPCFREGALPLVLLTTDEPPLSTGDTNKIPNWSTIVLPAMLARGARFIGILGSGAAAGTDTDLRAMATGTGAVDTSNTNAPLVFNGADATAATAIRDGVSTAVSGLPLQMRANVRMKHCDTKRHFKWNSNMQWWLN